MNELQCEECKSLQIRTTENYEICIRCGHRKENIKDGNG